MKKIYMATTGEYDDRTELGAFSTRDAARKFKRDYEAAWQMVGSSVTVDLYPVRVDHSVPIPQPRFECTIRIDSGAIHKELAYTANVWDRRDYLGICDLYSERQRYCGHHRDGSERFVNERVTHPNSGIYAISRVSIGDARKLAAAFRAQWLIECQKAAIAEQQSRVIEEITPMNQASWDAMTGRFPN